MSWQCEGVPPCPGCSDCLLVPIGSVLVPPVPIGSQEIPCECTAGPWRLGAPCSDCCGLGYTLDPLYPADVDVGLDTLRRELDPTFPDPVCWGCGKDCESMYFVEPGQLRHDFCSGCDPTMEPAR